ncbi:uncharacterized protein ACNS7B_015209 [Menidia menidia]
MESPGTLCLFLLLNLLHLSPAGADQALSTTQTYSSGPGDHDGRSTFAMEAYFSTTDQQNSSDGTVVIRSDCPIDTEMGLVAIGSAGGVILCLLVATIVLACQVRLLQNRAQTLRTSRSNMNLVSGTGYWDSDQTEAGGLVGPCDASVVLEEVRSDGKMEEKRQAEIQEAMEESGTGLGEVAPAVAFDPEEQASKMLSSSSQDYCLEVPRDVEDMPLVV